MGRIFNFIKSFNEKLENEKKQRLTMELQTALNTRTVNIAVISDLLSRGANPNGYVGSLTALHRAALGKSASLEATKLLLASGANPFLPAIYGLKEFRLSSLVKDRPDILRCIVDAELLYEKQNGPPKPIRSGCAIRPIYRPRP